MQYILTEEEFERVGRMYDPKNIDPMIRDLKTIIFRNAKFIPYLLFFLSTLFYLSKELIQFF